MENITKDDLRHLRMLLLNDISKLLDDRIKPETNEASKEWIRSKEARQIMSISPSTLQNIRITGKIRFQKVLGSYYYCKADLLKLFENEVK